MSAEVQLSNPTQEVERREGTESREEVMGWRGLDGNLRLLGEHSLGWMLSSGCFCVGCDLHNGEVLLPKPQATTTRITFWKDKTGHFILLTNSIDSPVTEWWKNHSSEDLWGPFQVVHKFFSHTAYFLFAEVKLQLPLLPIWACPCASVTPNMSPGITDYHPSKLTFRSSYETVGSTEQQLL